MFDPALLDRSAADLGRFVSGLDVEVVAVGDAQGLVRRLARMGRQVHAAIALLGARVADGARTEEEAARWLARETRGDEREAKERSAAGAATRDHAATRAAFQQGELARKTAAAIGAAAAADGRGRAVA